jgi:hypothetical protein
MYACKVIAIGNATTSIKLGTHMKMVCTHVTHQLSVTKLHVTIANTLWSAHVPNPNQEHHKCSCARIDVVSCAYLYPFPGPKTSWLNNHWPSPLRFRHSRTPLSNEDMLTPLGTSIINTPNSFWTSLFRASSSKNNISENSMPVFS